MGLLIKLSKDLQDGNVEEVKAGVEQALEEGIRAEKILNQGLLNAMDEIGEKFSNNEIFVPEVLIAARAMNGGMEILKPELAAEGVESRGRVLMGTVAGDLHDIGKNLVKMMMEGAGFEVKDLGTDVSTEEFVSAAEEYKPHIMAMSALLTTTMTNMEDVISAFVEAELREEVYIMVGGAPVNQEFAEEIGADAYAKDAAEAARKAKKVLK